MKAITLTQPWATLVAMGSKSVETRSWATGYRGEIAIHAGKSLAPVGGKSGLIDICNYKLFQQELYRQGYVTHNHRDWNAEPTAKMEFGAVIAVAELRDVVTTTEIAPFLSEMELEFGDYSPRRFAWILNNVRLIKPSIAVKGSLGLWEWK